MKNKIKYGLGWFVAQLLSVFFWVELKTRTPRLWMDLQWKRLWAKYPLLKNNLFHNFNSMTFFMILIIGHASDISFLTRVGLFGMTIALVLGTVNLIYDL